MTGTQNDKRRVQKMKSKRKQILVKKAFELSKLCQLSVCVICYDHESNVLQEFSSAPQFTSEAVVDHKKRFKTLKLNASRIDQRKYFPQKNFIEETQMVDFMKGFKNLRKSDQLQMVQAQDQQFSSGCKKQRTSLDGETLSVTSSDQESILFQNQSNGLN